MKLFLTAILLFSCTVKKELFEKEVFYGNVCGLLKIDLQNANEYLLIHHRSAGTLKSWGDYSRIDDKVFFTEKGHRLLNDTIEIGDREIEISIPENIDSTYGFKTFKEFSLELLSDTTARTKDFYCGGITAIPIEQGYYTYFKK